MSFQLSFGALVNAFRVRRKNPFVAVLGTRGLHDFLVVRRVSQHYNVGASVQWQRSNHSHHRFGRGHVFEPLLLAILFRVMRNLKRSAISRWRDQQAECETVHVLSTHFSVVVPVC